MTNPKQRPDYGSISYLLVVGSILASLTGAQLLAWQESQEATITIQPLDLPSNVGQGTTSNGFVLELKPIPTVDTTQPRVRPVARTQSSR